MANRLKETLNAGGTAYGIWLEWLNPDLVEFCGYLGFEYVVIDAEHSPVERSTCTELIRAANVVGMTPIVRVPDLTEASILGYLEIGAQGIYAPHVNTAADARRLVGAVKYAPEGHRGAGSWRAVQYGITQPAVDYVKQANQDTMVIALVEEVEGIGNLDEIVGVAGIDVVGIGTGDLSHTMGHPGHKMHPDVQKTALDAEERIRASGTMFDSVVASAEEAREAAGRGSRMISLAIRGLLAASCREFLNATAQSAPS